MSAATASLPPFLKKLQLDSTEPLELSNTCLPVSRNYFIFTTAVLDQEPTPCANEPFASLFKEAGPLDGSPSDEVAGHFDFETQKYVWPEPRAGAHTRTRRDTHRHTWGPFYDTNDDYVVDDISGSTPNELAPRLVRS